MDLHFVGCLNCGCVQLKELADPKKLYEDAYNVTYNYTMMRNHHEKFADFILKNLIDKNQLFEIGGSNGALARIIKSKVEIKYTILDLCDRNPNIEDVEFIQGNCEDMECPENTTLVMSHVLEHLYEPNKFIENISKKNIKQILISNPDMIGLLNENDLSFINFEHTYFCDTVFLDYLFNKYGFYREDIYNYENNSVFYNFVKKEIATDTENVIKDNLYLLESVKNYFLNRESIIKNTVLGKETYICPAGHYGQLIYYFLTNENKQKILGFLDGDSFKIGKPVYGTHLNTFKKDKISEYDDIEVIVCSSRYRDEIKSDLLTINENVRIINI
jgi:hypothetical protein